MFAALGRFAYRRRWAIVAAWLVLVLAGLPLLPSLPGLLKPGGFENPAMESARAGAVLRDELGQRGSVLVAVFRSSDARAVAEQANRARGIPGVSNVVTPIENPRQIAPDALIATALIVLSAEPDDAPTLIPAVKAALGNVPFQPIVTGGPVAYADIVHTSEQDLRRAELISVPLALVALVVVFGSLVAAGAPVVV